MWTYYFTKERKNRCDDFWFTNIFIPFFICLAFQAIKLRLPILYLLKNIEEKTF